MDVQAIRKNFSSELSSKRSENKRKIQLPSIELMNKIDLKSIVLPKSENYVLDKEFVEKYLLSIDDIKFR